jgi:predicted nucleic acid-binding protein
VILYLDASALVKQYVSEPGGSEVAAALRQASLVGTALISRAEVVAALAKAVRMRVMTREAGLSAVQAFRSDWQTLVRLPVSEPVVARADSFAWEYGLRGYDAVHLAAACAWTEAMGSPVTFATFDRGLWKVAPRVGLVTCPDDLPGLLEK